MARRYNITNRTALDEVLKLMGARVVGAALKQNLDDDLSVRLAVENTELRIILSIYFNALPEIFAAGHKSHPDNIWAIDPAARTITVYDNLAEAQAAAVYDNTAEAQAAMVEKLK